MDMKAGFGGWLGTDPLMVTGIQACSDWMIKTHHLISQCVMR